MKAFRKILLAGLVLVPLAAAAQAADYVTPVDSLRADDTGFYVRGDAGMSFLNWSGSDNDWAGIIGGGVGYRANDNLRSDVTVDWSGTYAIGAGASLSTTTVLGNLYYDFDSYSAFTPYVGAGVGYGWVNRDIYSDRGGLAAGLAAGVAVDLGHNFDLDIGYRFRDTLIKGSNPMEHQVTAGIRFSF